MRTYEAMHVISRKALLEFAGKHSDAWTPLDDWYRLAKKAEWKHLEEVRQTFPHADLTGVFTVFNIGGNKYRLSVQINYRSQRVYIDRVMTHAEYSRREF